MSTTLGLASFFERPIKSLPDALRVPLVAAGWVFFNLLLIALGVHDPKHPGLFFGATAGTVDGVFLSILAIAKLSQAHHAGAAGALAGYGLPDVLKKFDLTKQGAQWMHERIDPILMALFGRQNEVFHAAILKQIIAVACSAALVMLAALAVQLIRTSSKKSDSVQ